MKNLHICAHIGTCLLYTSSIPFFQECLLGISEAAASENYNVIITTGTATDYSGAKQLVEDQKVDGMILMRSYDEDLTLEYLTKQGIPVLSLIHI